MVSLIGIFLDSWKPRDAGLGIKRILVLIGPVKINDMRSMWLGHGHSKTQVKGMFLLHI